MAKVHEEQSVCVCGLPRLKTIELRLGNSESPVIEVENNPELNRLVIHSTTQCSVYLAGPRLRSVFLEQVEFYPDLWRGLATAVDLQELAIDCPYGLISSEHIGELSLATHILPATRTEFPHGARGGSRCPHCHI